MRANDIKKLYQLLRDRIGKANFSAECIDDIDRDFAGLEELLEFEHPKTKRIKSLTIKAHDYGGKESKSARIRFDTRFFRRGISLDVAGREDVVSRLRNDLLEVICETRPWYYFISKLNFIYFMQAIALLGTFFVMGLYFLSKPAKATSSDFTSDDFIRMWIVFVIVILIYAFAFSLNILRDKLFPPGVFAIGQGAKRFEHLERVQWTVVVGFVVSLAASIVVAAWPYLTHR